MKDKRKFVGHLYFDDYNIYKKGQTLIYDWPFYVAWNIKWETYENEVFRYWSETTKIRIPFNE